MVKTKFKFLRPASSVHGTNVSTNQAHGSHACLYVFKDLVKIKLLVTELRQVIVLG